MIFEESRSRRRLCAVQGMFVGWAVLSPLATYAGWAAGPVRDMAVGARGWILWIALAIMCTDALVSLLPVAFELLGDAILHRGLGQSYQQKETETEDRLVPNNWVIVGLVLSVLLGSCLVWVLFGTEGIKPWATFLGFILGALLSIIG